MQDPITVNAVRYVKLGRDGAWFVGSAMKRLRRALLVFTLLTLSAIVPANALSWRAEHVRDPFTEAEACRVLPGGAFTRALTGMSRLGVYYFFFERRGAEVRAGVTSDHGLPIAGDVQVRVGDGPLITITAADTPLDARPQTPAVAIEGLSQDAAAQIAAARDAALASVSPYRVLAGERARQLIADILAHDRTIWRTVGVNAATSSIGELEPNASLRRALHMCGLDAQ
ncbi:MAG: hypothetical protein AB7O04_00210 [Hyphomonadaceae bacterium]